MCLEKNRMKSSTWIIELFWKSKGFIYNHALPSAIAFAVEVALLWQCHFPVFIQTMSFRDMIFLELVLSTYSKMSKNNYENVISKNMLNNKPQKCQHSYDQKWKVKVRVTHKSGSRLGLENFNPTWKHCYGTIS